MPGAIMKLFNTNNICRVKKKSRNLEKTSTDPAAGSSGGFTIIEILIAMAIFAIGILGVATMQLSAVNGNSSARKSSEASAFVQDRIELLMSVPFANIVNSDQTNADGYRVLTTILSQSDLNADGTPDVMTIEVRVFDPSGAERGRVSFMKASNI